MPAPTPDLGASDTLLAPDDSDGPPAPSLRALFAAPTQRSDGPPRFAPADAPGDDTTPGRAHADRRAAAPLKIGRYHVLERLGAGGMGVVYAAFDPELDRRVALKLLHPERDGHDSQVRLLREAQALARLSHPNVVQIHDAGALGEQVFLAMEFVRGEDLRRWLAAADRPLADILRVFLDAGRGLAAAHAGGLVHRDFKPENVLVGADGRVRVADFGLARAGRDDDTTHAPPDASPDTSRGPLDVSLTATGAVLGTPAYMSPEQHMGRVADARSDQFSFCTALWEALHRRHPFRADTFVETSLAVLSGAIAEPDGDVGVPRRITEVLRRGLSVRPDDRFPDMPALLAALERDPSRARRRWLAGAALSTLLAGAAFAAADWRAHEASACTGAAAELASVWTDERRAAVAATLADADDPAGATPTLARLDAYALGWQAAHRDACLDHRRGEQSTATLDVRMRCLDRRRQALGAALERTLAGGDAAELVARLPALSPCDVPERALSEASRPDDPALARAVDLVDGRLLSARAQYHAGDVPGALTSAAAAAEEARRLAYRPLQADALATLGQIAMADGLPGDALPALAEAAVHALATGRDDLAADALARHFYLDGQSGRIADALAAAPIARAIAERSGSLLGLALVENNLGAVHAIDGDRARAREHLLRAVDLIARDPEADPIERSNYSVNLALVTDEPAARRAAFQDVVDSLAAQLGRHHPRTLQRRTMQAFAETDPRASATLFEALCPELPTHAPAMQSECQRCWYASGHLHAALGEAARAAEDFAAVLRCPTAAADADLSKYLALRRGKASAFASLLAGRPGEALAHADAALPLTEPFATLPWFAVEIAELQLARGRALLAQGRRDEARTALLAARAAFDADVGTGVDALFPVWRADVRAHLAALDAAPP